MKTILTMPDSDIALLTMAGEGRPFVLNRRTMAEMNTLLDEVERRRPRALVITGEGKFFCAGADIKEMLAMDGRELHEWALLIRLTFLIYQLGHHTISTGKIS